MGGRLDASSPPKVRIPAENMIDAPFITRIASHFEVDS